MDTYYYIKISTDGGIRVEHQSSSILSFDDLIKMIDGQPGLAWPRANLPLDGLELRLRMVFDENYSLLQLPLNPMASGIHGAPVFGNVILCTEDPLGDEDDMDMRAFTQREYEKIMHLLTTILTMVDWFYMKDKVVIA